MWANCFVGFGDFKTTETKYKETKIQLNRVFIHGKSRIQETSETHDSLTIVLCCLKT